MAYDYTKHFNNYSSWSSGSSGDSGGNLLNTHRALRNDIRTADGANTNFMLPQSSEDNGLAQQSTNIFVLSNGGLVGMIQSLQVQEQRNVNKLQAIGWEGVVQAVPSNTNGGTLNIQRIALYESSIWGGLGLTISGRQFNEIAKDTWPNGSVNDGDSSWKTPKLSNDNDNLSYKTATDQVFRTLKDQRVPLEIQIQTASNTTDATGSNFYKETYVDVWIQSYTRSYTVQSITISDQVTASYADVY